MNELYCLDLGSCAFCDWNCFLTFRFQEWLAFSKVCFHEDFNFHHLPNLKAQIFITFRNVRFLFVQLYLKQNQRYFCIRIFLVLKYLILNRPFSYDLETIIKIQDDVSGVFWHTRLINNLFRYYIRKICYLNPTCQGTKCNILRHAIN